MDHNTVSWSFNIILAIMCGIIIYVLFFDTVIKGPNSKDIVGKVYEWKGEKYTFEPRICAKIIK